MSSGMNVKEAEKIADKMSYREAIMNCLYAKCVPYRKATKIKMKRLLEDIEAEHKAMCETCVHKVNSEDIKQIRADALEEVLKNIEFGIEATGHNDQYTTGFCNGLIWLKSCITNDENPQFLEQLKGDK